jgi:hypothetical protein
MLHIHIYSYNLEGNRKYNRDQWLIFLFLFMPINDCNGFIRKQQQQQQRPLRYMLPTWILRLNESKKRQNSGTNISSCVLLLLHFLFSLVIRTSEWVGQDMYVYIHRHGVLFSLLFSIYHNVKISIWVKKHQREIFYVSSDPTLTRFSFYCQLTWERKRDRKLFERYYNKLFSLYKIRDHSINRIIWQKNNISIFYLVLLRTTKGRKNGKFCVL